ncbi:MAG: hypothetical protein ACLSV2_07725 [Clostridium sp.]
MGSMLDVDIIHEEAKKADAVIQLALGGFLTEAVGKGEQFNNCVEAIMSALEGSQKPYLLQGGIGLYLYDPNMSKVIDGTLPFSEKTLYAEMYPGIYSVLRDSKKRGVRGFLLSPGQVYGRDGGYIGPLPRTFEDCRKNGVIHYLHGSNGSSQYTHVTDYARAIQMGFEKAKGGEHYIVTSDYCDNLSMCRLVSKLCGLKGRLTLVDRVELEEKCGWARAGDFDLGDAVYTSRRIREDWGWMPQELGVVDELQRLIDEKVNVDDIYPMKSRQEILANVKL